jgi:hypothetical protein
MSTPLATNEVRTVVLTATLEEFSAYVIQQKLFDKCPLFLQSPRDCWNAWEWPNGYILHMAGDFQRSPLFGTGGMAKTEKLAKQVVRYYEPLTPRTERESPVMNIDLATLLDLD